MGSRSQLEDFKKISDILVSWIGVIALIGGGIWAGWTYSQQIKKNMASETLRYVTRFQEPDMRDARERVSIAWVRFNDEYNKVVDNAMTLPEEKGNEKVINFYKTMITKENLQAPIWRLIGFFDNLQICIEEHICDKSIAEKFFGSYALKFFNIHWVYISMIVRAENDETFADSIEKFVSNFKKSRIESTNEIASPTPD